MHKYRCFAVLALAAVAALPGCAVFRFLGLAKDPAFHLPSAMPNDFRFHLETTGAKDPPVDFVLKFHFNGRVDYLVKPRTASGRTESGNYEITEDKVADLYEALRLQKFESLPDTYTGENDAGQRLGVKSFYVYALGQEKSVTVRYAKLPEPLEIIQEWAMSLVPEWLRRGETPAASAEYPDQFIGDSDTRMFHLPESEKGKAVPVARRVIFISHFQALDAGFFPDNDPALTQVMNR